MAPPSCTLLPLTPAWQYVLELLEVAGQTLLTLSNADEATNVREDLARLSDTYLRLLHVRGRVRTSLRATPCLTVRLCAGTEHLQDRRTRHQHHERVLAHAQQQLLGAL